MFVIDFEKHVTAQPTLSKKLKNGTETRREKDSWLPFEQKKSILNSSHVFSLVLLLLCSSTKQTSQTQNELHLSTRSPLEVAEHAPRRRELLVYSLNTFDGKYFNSIFYLSHPTWKEEGFAFY